MSKAERPQGGLAPPLGDMSAEEFRRHGHEVIDWIADVDRLVVPALTHWNHPSFFAYFATSSSAPGIFGELLSAAFDTKAMLWRTSPASTELEEVALDWLRQMMALPRDF